MKASLLHPVPSMTLRAGEDSHGFLSHTRWSLHLKERGGEMGERFQMNRKGQREGWSCQWIGCICMCGRTAEQCHTASPPSGGVSSSTGGWWDGHAHNHKGAESSHPVEGQEEEKLKKQKDSVCLCICACVCVRILGLTPVILARTQKADGRVCMSTSWSLNCETRLKKRLRRGVMAAGFMQPAEVTCSSWSREEDFTSWLQAFSTSEVCNVC